MLVTINFPCIPCIVSLAVIFQEMGGYFIVNGIEKVIRMLIMPRRNYPIAMSRPKWKNRGQGYTQYGKCWKKENRVLLQALIIAPALQRTEKCTHFLSVKCVHFKMTFKGKLF